MQVFVAGVIKYILSLAADLLYLPEYIAWWGKSRKARPQSCRACGAPLEMSEAFTEKEELPLKRCLYCSTRIGWLYRPFEIEYLKFRRLKLASGLLAGLVIVVALIAVAQEQRLAACLSQPVVERLADSACTAPESLTARTVDVQVFQESQWRVVANERAYLGYFDGRLYQINEIARFSMRPMRLSPSGKQLLLDHGGGYLGIYPLFGQSYAQRLDLSACNLAQAELLDLSWSPDETSVVLLAQLGNRRSVKLATLTSTPSDIQIATCSDAYSLNVAWVDWLDNAHLLYLIDEGAQKRVEVRAADSAEAIFSAPLALEGQLSDLRTAPQGKYATFVAEQSNVRQLYWLDLTAQPRLYAAAQPIAREVPRQSFFSWADAQQAVYLSAENQLARLDLAERAFHTAPAPDDPRGRLVWLAWQNGE